MSPSSGPSSSRLAGFVLLGLAAIALVIGLVTAFGGDSEDQAGGPVAGTGNSRTEGPGSQGGGRPTAPSSSAPGEQPGGGNGQNGDAGGTGGTGDGAGRPGQPSNGTTTKVIPPPPAGADNGSRGDRGNGGAGAGGTAQGVTSSLGPVRVYNNSTIRGLAHRAAADFRGAGFTVSSVGNYSQGTIPMSTVYYRPGTSEQATATALANKFGMRVEQRFAGLQRSSPGVIAIVTNNYSN